MDYSIEPYSETALDLIRELKKEFHDNPLIFFGTSWGSVLSASTAIRMPELVDQVVEFGQVLKNLTFNRRSLLIIVRSAFVS